MFELSVLVGMLRAFGSPSGSTSSGLLRTSFAAVSKSLTAMWKQRAVM
jgi:hypothetical protein